jgi:hypothetical protein
MISPRRASRASLLVSVCTLALATACAPVDDMDVSDLEGSAEALAPPGFNLRDVRYGGSGCRSGTASVTLSESGDALLTRFGDFEAEYGPGLSRTEAQRSCQLTMTVSVPAGFQFAVISHEHRAFYSLDSRLAASVSTRVSMAGVEGATFASSRVAGPHEGDRSHYRDDLAPRWSPCGAATALTITDTARIAPSGIASSSASGLYTGDSVDGTVTHSYGLEFRACR